MSDITDFIKNLKQNGIARTNRFRATFNLPDSLNNTSASLSDGETIISNSDGGKRLTIMCVAANIPGYSVGAVNSTNTGVTRKMPFDRSTGDLELRFYCSGDMMEKKLFDSWMHTIFDDDLKIAYYDDYVTDLTIEQLDAGDNTVYSATITECYPGIIGPIVYDRTDSNQIMTFSVGFNYRRIQENDDSVTTSNTVTTSNITFGGTVSKPELQQIQLPDAPALDPNYPNIVVDIMKNIARVKQEIENGLDATAASRIIRNLQQDLAASTGVGTDITPALTYLNNILYTINRGSVIGTAQAILG